MFTGVKRFTTTPLSAELRLRRPHLPPATFTQDADFRRPCSRRVRTSSALTFKQAGGLNQATFEQAADFESPHSRTTQAFFIGDQLRGATPTSPGHVRRRPTSSGAPRLNRAPTSSRPSSRGTADFSAATFKDRAEFRETIFREDASAEPGPIFSLARFEKPELVLFYKTYLGQALFHNCDVSRCRLLRRALAEASQQQEDGAGGRRGTRFDPVNTEALRTKEGEPDERNYGLIAELYQQLKKNYDDRKDYWTAGDFHYGEMEMKRLRRPPNRLSRWIAKDCNWLAKRTRISGRWPREKVFQSEASTSCAAIHRLGLGGVVQVCQRIWGELRPPSSVACCILVAFMFLYPWPGLRPSAKSSAPEPAASESRLAAKASTPELSYSNFFRYRSTEPGGARVHFLVLAQGQRHDHD